MNSSGTIVQSPPNEISLNVVLLISGVSRARRATMAMRFNMKEEARWSQVIVQVKQKLSTRPKSV